jgi:hypothetical protein
MTLFDTYSIQTETAKILWEGVLRNPLHRNLPNGIEDAARAISFSGSNLPFIPINWRFAESVSALKGFQGAMLNVLLNKKYGIPYQKIHIDTYVCCCSSSFNLNDNISSSETMPSSF